MKVCEAEVLSCPIQLLLSTVSPKIPLTALNKGLFQRNTTEGRRWTCPNSPEKILPK